MLRIHRAMHVCVSIIMQYVTYTQSYACMCVNYNAVCYVYTELCLYVLIMCYVYTESCMYVYVYVINTVMFLVLHFLVIPTVIT